MWREVDAVDQSCIADGSLSKPFAHSIASWWTELTSSAKTHSCDVCMRSRSWPKEIDDARENAQRWKTVFVRSVHEIVRAERQFNEAREDPQRAMFVTFVTRPSRITAIWPDTRGLTEAATSSVLFDVDRLLAIHVSLDVGVYRRIIYLLW